MGDAQFAYQQFPSIVISYARSTSDVVDRIERDLQGRGVPTWVDRRKLEAGQVWDAVIRRAIDNCRILLVIISPAALDSPFVKKEYRYALKLRKEVIPVVYYPTAQIPKELARLQWVNLQAGVNFETVYQSGLEELVTAIAYHETIISQRRRQAESGLDAKTGGAMHAALGMLRSIHNRWNMSWREKFNGGLAPSVSVIVNAWTRRIIYLLLTIACIAIDYVVISYRAPVLYGGGAPSAFLRTLFGNLQTLMGLMFVSIAAISGMLIQDYSVALSGIVGLEPNISETSRKIKRGISVGLLVAGAMLVMLIGLMGISSQVGAPQPLGVVYVILAGAVIILALSTFLAWNGLIEAGMAIGWLILGGVAAISLAIISTLIRCLLVLLSGLLVALTATYGALRKLA